MNKRLSDSDVDAIIGIIDGWSGEQITWGSLIDAIERRLGFRLSRQALSSHSRIKLAFQTRKKGLRREAPPPPSVASVLQQRLSRAEAELERLKAENAALLEQFVRWQYNAEAHGLGKEKLNNPLPAIDRERTD